MLFYYYNSGNIGTHGPPNMYTPSLHPTALMIWVHISARPLVLMLQLLNKSFLSLISWPLFVVSLLFVAVIDLYSVTTF